MNASGLGGLWVFSLAVALVLSAAPRWWAKRGALAWYLWLSGVGLSSLLWGQVVLGLRTTGRFRFEDVGPDWLGDDALSFSLSVDPTSAYAIGALLLLLLFAGVAHTRVGTRVGADTAASLATLSWLSGGACLAMSGHALLPLLAGWLICGQALRSEQDSARAGWAARVGDAGGVLFVVALLVGAGEQELGALAASDRSAFTQAVLAIGGIDLSSAALAVGGLALAIAGRGAAFVERTRAVKRDWLVVVGFMLGALVPWTVICLRAGRLFCLASWGMVLITVVGLWLALGGALALARMRASGSGRVFGFARYQAGLVVAALGFGGADLALSAAIVGAGSSLTFALARGRVGPGIGGRMALMAWLGVGPVGGLWVHLTSLGWAHGHDAVASMGINYIAWGVLSLCLVLLGLGLAGAREAGHEVDVDEGAGFGAGFGTHAGWIWGLATLALVWPARFGGPSWLGKGLAVDQSFGWIFAEQLRELHVGLRPDFVEPDRGLVQGEAWLALGLSVLLAGGAYLWGRRASAAPGNLREWAHRTHERVGSLPVRGVELCRDLLVAFAELLTQVVPRLLAGLGQDLSAAMRRRGREGRGWTAVARLPLLAMAFVALVFGWLYFKPSVIDFRPSQFHNFGGLRPELRRASDPSRERARAAAKARAQAEATGSGGASNEGQQLQDAKDEHGLKPREVPQ